MSKVLVQGNVVDTARAVFSGEDQTALDMYSSFEGFQIKNIKISQLFNEFTESIETFHLPEKVGEELYWPEGETFCIVTCQNYCFHSNRSLLSGLQFSTFSN